MGGIIIIESGFSLYMLLYADNLFILGEHEDKMEAKNIDISSIKFFILKFV
tara:strand:+ start:617 stop:769 length:153 start_codon:yes stop_codon:yes gene_type:complete